MAGMYSVFDREGKGRNQTLDFNNLNKILEDSDEVSDRVFLSDGVGFAGVGAYGSGEKTSEQLAKDGSVIIQYGKEGAIDLAEVTSKQYNDRAYVYAIDNPTENVQKVSALGGGSSGLDIVGDGYDDVNGVFSFGVKA